MVCDICRNVVCFDPDNTGHLNKLLECSVCHVKVHESCFGGTTARRAKSWTCTFCSRNDRNQSAFRLCELCPTKAGALKKTTCRKWVHLICGLFHESCVFEDILKLEPINIQNVPRSLFKFNCYICVASKKKNVKGACVTCAYPKCNYSMHVTCAQKTNSLREDKDLDSIKYTAYCDIHIDMHSQKRLSLLNITKHISARDVSYSASLQTQTISETDADMAAFVIPAFDENTGTGPQNIAMTVEVAETPHTDEMTEPGNEFEEQVVLLNATASFVNIEYTPADMPGGSLQTGDDANGQGHSPNIIQWQQNHAFPNSSTPLLNPQPYAFDDLFKRGIFYSLPVNGNVRNGCAPEAPLTNASNGTPIVLDNISDESENNSFNESATADCGKGDEPNASNRQSDGTRSDTARTPVSPQPHTFGAGSPFEERPLVAVVIEDGQKGRAPEVSITNSSSETDESENNSLNESATADGRKGDEQNASNRQLDDTRSDTARTPVSPQPHTFGDGQKGRAPEVSITNSSSETDESENNFFNGSATADGRKGDEQNASNRQLDDTQSGSSSRTQQHEVEASSNDFEDDESFGGEEFLDKMDWDNEGSSCDQPVPPIVRKSSCENQKKKTFTRNESKTPKPSTSKQHVSSTRRSHKECMAIIERQRLTIARLRNLNLVLQKQLFRKTKEKAKGAKTKEDVTRKLTKETIRELELFSKDASFDAKFIAKGMDLVFDKEELTDGKPCQVLKKLLGSERMEPILDMYYRRLEGTVEAEQEVRKKKYRSHVQCKIWNEWNTKKKQLAKQGRKEKHDEVMDEL